MTAWVLGLLAGWSVLRLCRVGHRYPWRVADLPERAVPGRVVRARRSRARHLRSAAARAHPTPDRRSRLRGGLRGRLRPAGARVDHPDDLVAVIELLVVALGAGHTVHRAVAEVAAIADGPCGLALGEAAASFDRGVPLSDALDAVNVGRSAGVAALTTTLTSSLRSGAPAVPALQRLADAERRRARRRAETRVRRLPVLLLAPLVGMVLPAFALLTVVPVGLTTARAGLLPASP